MGKKKDKKENKAKKNQDGVGDAQPAAVPIAGLQQENVVSLPSAPGGAKIKSKDYEKELERLEIELVKLQEWIKQKGLKVVVIFEGRDTAGKGGVIKSITNRLSPRVVRTVALPTPTDREKTQYYLQRYIGYLPAAGEMVLFDRSWYNRAGVEPVMGFCTEQEYQDFLNVCPVFEKTLVDSGILLIKYWLDIRHEVQEKRFRERAEDPRKFWKLSPIDIKGRTLWDEYTKARNVMFERTATPYAPWYVVDFNVQKHGRLSCITHLLSLITYEDLLGEPTELKDIEVSKDDSVPALSDVIAVPGVHELGLVE